MLLLKTKFSHHDIDIKKGDKITIGVKIKETLELEQDI